ncbi:squalene/phytoene synthase family protein [Bacillus sp. 31A1R]|uniref:Squalene/phytoene synthase family protein n=1 Tax=Robertmurraya mangrovi TaxID=3098077 RepID=A0ABU5IT32_9BACI|nr:squalene/phytoene synthase family protein [Bacillus sp. 31A1R]MDZ5470291.1 squalene/phytoene synthase family protein [Bacillus sp. 31A1R]
MLDQIAKAYDDCEEVIKKNSATFYKAFSFLPSEEKRAVWAIYTFCRRVDDIMDEGLEPEKEILVFEKEFDLFKKGKIIKHDFMWLALADVFSKYQMDIRPFEDMIIGQKMDLIKNRYETVEEVLHYSYHVASTVGLMLLPILAPGKTEILRSGAIKLGLGMQITNILRDIGEDLLKGRIYVPSELFEKHHYSYKEFLQFDVNERFINIVEELARLADSYYSEALETIDEYPLYSRTPVKGAAYLYRAILDEIRKNGYNTFQKRNYVTKEVKDQIIAMM